MRIGILGSGSMGGKLGTIFAKAGHDVVFSYARSHRKLTRLARHAGRRAAAGTPREAAEGADVLLLAVHWSRVNDVLKQAGDLSGKVLITCSLPMNASDTALAIAHTSSGAEALAKKTKRAKVVSAFGTVPSEVLFDVFEARRRTRRRPSLLYCGNNDEAKSVVAQLIRDVGFEPVDAGPLRIARYLLVLGAPSYNWQPARPTLAYLGRLGDLKAMPVALVFSGGGMTDRALKIMSDHVTQAHDRIVGAIEIWTTRPNAERHGLTDPQEIMRRAGARVASSAPGQGTLS